MIAVLALGNYWIVYGAIVMKRCGARNEKNLDLESLCDWNVPESWWASL